MAELPFDLVTVDIDGTLTIESGWRFFARRRDKVGEYDATNLRYLDGKESEDVHLRGLLRIVEGVPISRVEAWMEETPKLLGIREAVGTLRAMGATVALLSHNPGYVSDWYARRFGFEDWDGTSDRPEPEVVDGVVGPPGGIRADKIGGLRRLLERHPTAPTRVAHLGDAWADAQVFPRVGFGIAINSTSIETIRAADLSIRILDLREVVEPLRTAHPRSGPELTL
ncbi:MAG TPA: HAD family hydrolase [Thermoplasmata archaeon]|nr:HAD family hydrolase [Thermoplasmata archaeon]